MVDGLPATLSPMVEPAATVAVVAVPFMVES